MRTLKKLKLSQLSDTEMKEREMNMLKGGTSYNCSCGCLEYGKPGGATIADNQAANIKGNHYTPGYAVCDSWIGQWTINNYGNF